ncbi:MAG: CrcB family protein [Propionicimonas sp.]|nr:CrcB family protein [Propionicimonas sp.]
MAVSAAGHPRGAPDAQPLARLALVGIGGGLGTLLRWSLESAYPAIPGSWPWATFVINLTGALALGALLEGLAAAGPDTGRRRAVRLGVGTGVLGGYTTYSTFAVESVRLVGAGQGWLALGYALGSVLAGVACAAAGSWLVRRLGTPGAGR